MWLCNNKPNQFLIKNRYSHSAFHQSGVISPPRNKYTNTNTLPAPRPHGGLMTNKHAFKRNKWNLASRDTTWVQTLVSDAQAFMQSHIWCFLPSHICTSVGMHTQACTQALVLDIHYAISNLAQSPTFRRAWEKPLYLSHCMCMYSHTRAIDFFSESVLGWAALTGRWELDSHSQLVTCANDKTWFLAHGGKVVSELDLRSGLTHTRSLGCIQSDKKLSVGFITISVRSAPESVQKLFNEPGFIKQQPWFCKQQDNWGA